MADKMNDERYGQYGMPSIPARSEAKPPQLELVENPPSKWDEESSDEDMDRALRMHCAASLRQLQGMTVDT